MSVSLFFIFDAGIFRLSPKGKRRLAELLTRLEMGDHSFNETDELFLLCCFRTIYKNSNSFKPLLAWVKANFGVRK